jgi:hypothetical protein
VNWKFHVLSSGFLLPNVLARAYHTYAVSLILSNYRRLVLQQQPPSKLALIEERDWISQISDSTQQFPQHSLDLQVPDNQRFKWFRFYSDPYMDKTSLLTCDRRSITTDNVNFLVLKEFDGFFQSILPEFYYNSRGIHPG